MLYGTDGDDDDDDNDGGDGDILERRSGLPPSSRANASAATTTGANTTAQSTRSDADAARRWSRPRPRRWAWDECNAPGVEDGGNGEGEGGTRRGLSLIHI